MTGAGSIADAPSGNGLEGRPGLDVQAFLAELVNRMREALRADTAAVLLRAPSSDHLVATAASGLEEEVLQGSRVPVGQGFAGRVAALNQPVQLHQVDSDHVVNPLLITKGIRSLLGVPLLADGSVIGVLHVGSLTARRFSRRQMELLQFAAECAAAAVQSAQVRTERAAAAALHRSLVPTALPALPGVEMAARYVPGHGAVGGDWYDVFTLPSGELCVVMGDVAGTGLPAAVIMGRMRSALRAYALESSDPAVVLSRLDRKIQYFEPGALATVLYAVFERSMDAARVSSAGHFPPVVCLPGQSTSLAEVPGDLMIGVDSAAPRRVTPVPVPTGAVLAFFTDGLVERRHRALDDGLTALCEAVSPMPPEQGCAGVMSAMVGNEPVDDDIALLMLRRDAAGGTARPALAAWPEAQIGKAGSAAAP